MITRTVGKSFSSAASKTGKNDDDDDDDDKKFDKCEWKVKPSFYLETCPQRWSCSGSYFSLPLSLLLWHRLLFLTFVQTAYDFYFCVFFCGDAYHTYPIIEIVCTVICLADGCGRYILLGGWGQKSVAARARDQYFSLAGCTFFDSKRRMALETNRIGGATCGPTGEK